MPRNNWKKFDKFMKAYLTPMSSALALDLALVGERRRLAPLKPQVFFDDPDQEYQTRSYFKEELRDDHLDAYRYATATTGWNVGRQVVPRGEAIRLVDPAAPTHCQWCGADFREYPSKPGFCKQCHGPKGR